MVAVAFTGSIPNIAVVRNSAATPYDSSVRFTGDQTPFTYNIQSGTLPAGLTLGTTTGIISGTPTTHGRSSGLSIRATDTATNTATSNTFAVTVGPYGVLFGPTGYIFLSRSIQFVETEFMFKSGSTYFSICGVVNPTEENLYYFEVNKAGSITVQTPVGVMFTNVPAFVNDVWYKVKLQITGGGSVWSVYLNDSLVIDSAVGLSDFLFDYVGYNPAGPGWSYNVLMRRFTAGASPVSQETFSWLYSNINNAGITSQLNGSAAFQQMNSGAWTAYDVATPYAAKPLKYWNGSAWVAKPLKYWNGSAWVAKPLKVVT